MTVIHDLLSRTSIRVCLKGVISFISCIKLLFCVTLRGIDYLLYDRAKSGLGYFGLEKAIFDSMAP